MKIRDLSNLLWVVVAIMTFAKYIVTGEVGYMISSFLAMLISMGYNIMRIQERGCDER